MNEELIKNNPCIKFIVDNYGMLRAAHPGKVVMVMNVNEAWVDLVGCPPARVTKVFDSMIAAMQYTDAIDMGHVPYALKECNDGDAMTELIFSVGCKV